MRKTAIALIALFPAPTHATCPAETAFACQIGKKSVEVCLGGDVVSYAFGPAGRPELTLSVPIDQAAYRPWNGIGRYFGDAVDFQNDGVSYEVWFSVDRLTDDHPLSAGINVVKADALIAQLACTPGSIVQKLDIIMAAKEAAGQCWNYRTLSWGPPCP